MLFSDIASVKEEVDLMRTSMDFFFANLPPLEEESARRVAELIYQSAYVDGICRGFTLASIAAAKARGHQSEN